MCWKASGLPPPSGEKNVVPAMRSISTITSAPAKNWVSSRLRIEVQNADQTKIGRRPHVMPGARIVHTVVMMLRPPKIDERPNTMTAAQNSTWPLLVLVLNGG